MSQPQDPNVTPPAAPAPSPAHASDPPGWAPGAYAKFQETARERDDYKAKWEKATGDLRSYETKYNETVTRYSQEIVLAKAGGQFGHPSVQRAVRNEYAEYAREAGESAKAFDAWFGDTETRQNPLIGRFFESPQAPAAPEPPARQPAPPPPNPNIGAREPQAVAPSEPTPEEIMRAVRNAPRGPGSSLGKTYTDFARGKKI
jgi:hypothetical protein